MKTNYFNNSTMQDIISSAVKNIQEQQNEVIKKRFFEVLGYELDLIEEGKRRFPRIGIFQQNNETHYYWNDGSIDGIRIITFIQDPMNFEGIKDNKLSIGLSYR